ncbi:hypothetical protein D3C81_1936990 [compost metagenome]
MLPEARVDRHAGDLNFGCSDAAVAQLGFDLRSRDQIAVHFRADPGGMCIVVSDDRDQRGLEGRVQPFEAGNNGTGNEVGADDNIRFQLLHNILRMCIKNAVQGKCGKTIE